jgi:2-dehydropantoate 2-reductase
MNTLKILVAGIGGVGGFLGAALAAGAELKHNAEIYFLSRGENLRRIAQDGITVERNSSVLKAHPASISDNTLGFPKMDIVIIACKSYDLESVCRTIDNCVDGNTLIIPVLNGIGHEKTVNKILPDVHSLAACIYIVAVLNGPGHIVVSGNRQKFYVELLQGYEDRLYQLQEMFKEAAVHMELIREIKPVIWEKFVFISPLATLTSAIGAGKSRIAGDPALMNTLRGLMHEVLSVADANQAGLPDDIFDHLMNSFYAVPDGNSTSMERDFSIGKKTEMEVLTAFVIHEADKHGIEVPLYRELYAVLLKKSTGFIY